MVKFRGLMTLHRFSKTLKLKMHPDSKWDSEILCPFAKLNGLSLLYHLNAHESIIFTATTTAYMWKSTVKVTQYQADLMRLCSSLTTGSQSVPVLRDIFPHLPLAVFSFLLNYLQYLCCQQV